MEDRLKERLTGAILLVVLVVVLVPAMFRGDRPGAAGAGSAPGGGTQQQVYTIDLQGTAPAGPDFTAVASQPAALPAESPAAPDEAHGAERIVSPPSAVAAPVAAASPPVAMAPAATAAPLRPIAESRSAAEPKTAVAVKPVAQASKPAETHAVAAKSVAKPAAAPATKTAAQAGGGFVVQVGSFAKRENAATMVKQAAKKGAHLSVAGPDDRGLFRVRSPVVRTRQEAVSLQEKLQSQGFKGVVGAVN